ncbi:hypothetical protein KN1_09700 [Stygiolobus caldivivus]|uniref:Uncharacterized protein n=1 Tax=Stygiolobus caldivivus TaxID=2824673 RepID=A0A8D5ZEH1_9CREN|nr:hypothetical protein KN1_09700 [Stygiolobus caldivivus]
MHHILTVRLGNVNVIDLSNKNVSYVRILRKPLLALPETLFIPKFFNS